MCKQAELKVYFSITGDFVCKDVLSELSCSVVSFWDKDDIRKADGKEYGFSSIILNEYQTDECYYIEDGINALLSMVKDKVSLLKKLRLKYNLTYCIEVVPTIFSTEMIPALFLDNDIIEFCNELKAAIDFDYSFCIEV